MELNEIDGLIDGYIKNTLSQQQLSDFEAILKSENDIQKRVEARKLALMAFREIGNENLKKKLIAHDHKKTQKTRWVYISAAAVISLLIISTFLLFDGKNNELQQFDFYEEGIPTLMGDGDEIKMHEGIDLFKMDKYDEAIAVLNTINSKNDTIYYHIGVAHFRLENWEKSVEYFNQVTNEKNSLYLEKAEFRKAVSNMHLERFEVAKRQLENILNDSSHTFFEEAVLLEKHAKQ